MARCVSSDGRSRSQCPSSSPTCRAHGNGDELRRTSDLASRRSINDVAATRPRNFESWVNRHTEFISAKFVAGERMAFDVGVDDRDGGLGSKSPHALWARGC
jgi:hypothetical protein